MSDHSITSLIEKLEQAEVGSGHLDADLMEAFGYSTIRARLHPRGPNWRYRGAGRWGFESHWCKTPDLTTSLDDALWLAGQIMSEDEVLFWLNQVVYRADQDTVNGTIKALPLKLCAAILRVQSEARV